MNKQDYSKTYYAIGISIIVAVICAMLISVITSSGISAIWGGYAVWLLIGIVFIAAKDRARAIPLRMIGICLCGMCATLIFACQNITNDTIHTIFLVIAWIMLMASFVINHKIRKAEKKALKEVEEQTVVEEK